MIEINREELAHAGGLFTGEGCISFAQKYPNPNPRKVPRPQLQIQMTDLPPLQRFQAAVGGLGKIYGPYQRKPSRAARDPKPTWTWTCSGYVPVQAVIAMLWPWLCPRRQARAAEVLDLYLAWDYPEEKAA